MKKLLIASLLSILSFGALANPNALNISKYTFDNCSAFPSTLSATLENGTNINIITLNQDQEVDLKKLNQHIEKISINYDRKKFVYQLTDNQSHNNNINWVMTVKIGANSAREFQPTVYLQQPGTSNIIYQFPTKIS